MDNDIIRTSEESSTNSKETTSAIFHDLNPKTHEIRLVLLEPSRDPDATVVCKLKIARLGSNPGFQALSWAWGDLTVTKPMFLNDRQWHAPENLVQGLMCLRSHEITKIIWIDALCIHPSHTHAARKERGHQVQLMKQIYRQASNVVIWMGIPSESLGYFLLTSVLGGQSLVDAFHANGEETILGVLKMLELPWWQRLWVLQEAILPSMASMHFGSEAVPFWYLLDDLITLRRHLRINAAGYSNDGSDWTKVRHAFEASVDIFDKMRRAQSEITYRPLETSSPKAPGYGPWSGAELVQMEPFRRFSNDLVTCRYQQTSNPRDKIFALLGLADDVVAVRLEPDYNQTIESTFARTAKTLIEASRSMHLLSQALLGMVRVSSSRRPSWVPDWTLPFGAISKASAERARDRSRWEYFRASNNILRFNKEELTPEGILRCDGICIDRIRTCSEVFQDKPSYGGWIQSFLIWEAFLQDNIDKVRGQMRGYQGFGNFTPSFQDIITFIYLLHPSRPQMGSTTTEDLPHCFGPDAIRIFWLTTLQGVDIPWERLGSLPFRRILRRRERDVHLQLELCKLPIDHGAFEILQDLTADRRSFLTEDGMYGNGPPTMRAGDEIFILAGGNFPVVLRPVPGTPGAYKYRGECYLYEIMNGQATTDHALSMKWRRRASASSPAYFGPWDGIYLI